MILDASFNDIFALVHGQPGLRVQGGTGVLSSFEAKTLSSSFGGEERTSQRKRQMNFTTSNDNAQLYKEK